MDVVDNPPPSEFIIAALRKSGLRLLAEIREDSNAAHVALTLPWSRTCVLRCVKRPQERDYRALKTMLREGDFDHAVLIYCDEDQPHLSDEIESWPISRIEELARRLAEGKRHE